MGKTYNEYKVSSTARGVTFERNKTGIKVESIFPNKDMAIAAAMAEATVDVDSALFVDGELYYFSEEVDESGTNELADPDTVADDIAYINESDILLTIDDNEPDMSLGVEAEEDNKAEQLIDPSNYYHSTLIPSSSRSNVYWGYNKDGDRLTIDVVAFDRPVGKVKVYLLVDGKERAARNVFSDKVTSIIVKKYESVTMFSYVVNEDGTEGERAAEANITI